MKKIISFILVCFLCVMPISMQAKSYDDDMRAVWIATVYNLDYPSTKNNITAQQTEFNEILDTLKSIGMNTVIVQVRPKADALYKSTINPWSDILTGVQGKNPGYDPLAFMVEAAHSKGMEIHAWLNPYRVTTSGTDVNALCNAHPARLNPDWIFSYDNALYYNPEVEGVKQHIVDTVKEIATNYDVDGIHFDDYFYPSNYPLPSGETKDGSVANARREAVNDMVRRVSETIRTVNTQLNKSIQFGISPPGIWKNRTSDVSGSSTNGREAYYALFADSRTWIKKGWIDYIVPQIYWKIGHSKADYETLVKWWANEVKGTKVKLYIGQGIYTDEVAKEITKELQMNQRYPEIKGSMYFSLKDLLDNRQNCRTSISQFYKQLGPSINNSSTGNNNSTNNGSTGNNSSTNNGSIGNNSSVNNGNTGNNNSTSNNTSNNNSTNSSNTGNNSSTSNNASNNSSANTNTVVSVGNIGKIGIVDVDSLNIREGARTDRPIIKKVTEGTKVKILDVLNGWYKVQLEDATKGWASGEFIKVTDETAPTSPSTVQKPSESSKPTQTDFPRTGTVNATNLNVREGAKIERPIIASLSKGTKVTLLDVLNGWYKVKLSDGKVGWASQEFIDS